jgi:hypothetical protein
LLALNIEKTYFIHFTNWSTCTSEILITYEDKKLCTAIETISGYLIIILFLGKHKLNLLSIIQSQHFILCGQPNHMYH